MSDSLQFLPRAVSWAVDVLVLFLFLKAIFTKNSSARFSLYLYWPILVIIIMFFSLIVNDENILLMLPSFKSYLKFPLLLVALILINPSLAVLKKTLIIFIWCVLIQVPITIVQALKNGTVGDGAGGTLGLNTTGTMAIITLIMMCIMLEKYFSEKNTKYLFYAVILFIPSIAGSAKFSFIVGPLIFMIYFLLNSSSPKKVFFNVIMTLILALIFVNLIQVFDSYDKGYITEWIADPRGAYEYELRVSNRGGSASSGRLGSMTYVLFLVSDSWEHLLFGFGPSSSVESFLGSDFESSYYKSGVFDTGMPTFQRILAELGMIGIALFLLIFVSMFRDAKRSKRLIFFSSVLLVMIAGSFYTNTFLSDPISFIFFFIVYILFRENREKSRVL